MALVLIASLMVWMFFLVTICSTSLSLKMISFLAYWNMSRWLLSTSLIHELFDQSERDHRCLNLITCILRGDGIPAHEVLAFTVIMLVAFPSS